MKAKKAKKAKWKIQAAEKSKADNTL
jgi:hypothetical protein